MSALRGTSERLKLDTLDIRGTKVDVFVDRRSGRFVATVEEAEFSAETRDALRDKLVIATRRGAAKVSVPFASLSKNGEITTGTVVGIHGGNRNALIVWDNKPGIRRKGPEQVSPYNLNEYVRPLTTEERAEWQQRATALVEAEKAVHEFRKRVQFDVSKATKDAIEAAVADPK